MDIIQKTLFTFCMHFLRLKVYRSTDKFFIIILFIQIKKHLIQPLSHYVGMILFLTLRKRSKLIAYYLICCCQDTTMSNINEGNHFHENHMSKLKSYLNLQPGGIRHPSWGRHCSDLSWLISWSLMLCTTIKTYFCYIM